MNIEKLIRQYLIALDADEIKTTSGRCLRSTTKRSYRHAMELYLKHGAFDLLSLKQDASVEEKRLFTKNFQKHIEEFSDSLVFSINTRATVVNIVGIVLNHIANEVMITIPKLRRPKPVEQPIMTLSDTFVKRFLTDEEMYNSLSSRNKAIWEVCAIMLVTSLRIIDACALTEMDFDFGKDGLFLIKQNRKTGDVTSCPLTPLLSKIITHNLKSGRVYSKSPVRTVPDTVRKQLPDFFKLYKETHAEVIVRKYDDNRRIGSNVAPLYKVIHPHMLRKTAITMMLASGVSPEHAKFASGHSPTSKSFDRYIGFSNQRYQSELQNFYNTIV